MVGGYLLKIFLRRLRAFGEVFCHFAVFRSLVCFLCCLDILFDVYSWLAGGLILLITDSVVMLIAIGKLFVPYFVFTTILVLHNTIVLRGN